MRENKIRNLNEVSQDVSDKELSGASLPHFDSTLRAAQTLQHKGNAAYWAGLFFTGASALFGASQFAKASGERFETRTLIAKNLEHVYSPFAQIFSMRLAQAQTAQFVMPEVTRLKGQYAFMVVDPERGQFRYIKAEDLLGTALDESITYTIRDLEMNSRQVQNGLGLRKALERQYSADPQRAADIIQGLLPDIQRDLQRELERNKQAQRGNSSITAGARARLTRELTKFMNELYSNENSEQVERILSGMEKAAKNAPKPVQMMVNLSTGQIRAIQNANIRAINEGKKACQAFLQGFTSMNDQQFIEYFASATVVSFGQEVRQKCITPVEILTSKGWSDIYNEETLSNVRARMCGLTPIEKVCNGVVKRLERGWLPPQRAVVPNPSAPGAIPAPHVPIVALPPTPVTPAPAPKTPNTEHKGADGPDRNTERKDKEKPKKDRNFSVHTREWEPSPRKIDKEGPSKPEIKVRDKTVTDEQGKEYKSREIIVDGEVRSKTESGDPALGQRAKDMEKQNSKPESPSNAPAPDAPAPGTGGGSPAPSPAPSPRSPKLPDEGIKLDSSPAPAPKESTPETPDHDGAEPENGREIGDFNEPKDPAESLGGPPGSRIAKNG